MNRTDLSPGMTPRRSRWRGRRLAGFGLVLLGLAAPGCAAANHKEQDQVDPVTLPQQVRDGLDRAARVYPEPLAGAKWASVTRPSGTDHPLYQLRGANGRGRAIEAEVTQAGRVVEVEEYGVPLGEVPAAVMDALKARMPHANPDRVEAIYQAGNPRPVCYGFEGRDERGTEIEVYVSADGKACFN
ncbi:hypothetical protein J0H58_06115 [bacterium]|nr:hypothetical protein [bacterium]